MCDGGDNEVEGLEVGLLATARSCDPPNKNNNNPPEQQRQQTHGEGPKGGWARARCARANAGRSDDTLNTAVAMAARTTTTAAAEADAHSSPYAESCSCSPRLALSRWRSPSPLSVSFSISLSLCLLSPSPLSVSSLRLLSPSLVWPPQHQIRTEAGAPTWSVQPNSFAIPMTATLMLIRSASGGGRGRGPF